MILLKIGVIGYNCGTVESKVPKNKIPVVLPPPTPLEIEELLDLLL